ncbi:MAG: PilN domain-containing protein [Actinomycetes bacterium]
MTLTTSTRTATVPRVNLLPPEIAEAERLRKLQMGLGAGLAVVVVGLGLAYVSASSSVSSARSQLDATQAQTVGLQAQAAQYSQVPATLAQVAAARAELTASMGQEVRWSYYLNDLALLMPANVGLTSLSINQSLSSPVTSPVGTAGIATVSFTGNAKTHLDVAAFLDALASKEPDNADPYLASSTETAAATSGSAGSGSGAGGSSAAAAQPEVNFSVSVTVTSKAYSNRYTSKAGS